MAELTRTCENCDLVNTGERTDCADCGTPLPAPARPGSDSPDQPPPTAASGAGAPDDDRPGTASDSAFRLSCPAHFDVTSTGTLLLGRRCTTTPDEITRHLTRCVGVSRVHCLILCRDQTLTVHDLASLNGTSLNGQRIEPGGHASVRLDDLPVTLRLGRNVEYYLEPVYEW